VNLALKPLAVRLLPYPDPWYRWRMRRAARALVTCSPWPDEEASSTDIARLALLRLLNLQRETHRSARIGILEGTMLLARASVDTCISALYWLDQEDAGSHLTKGNAKSAKQMLKVVMDLLKMPDTALDEAIHLIGEPTDLPRLRLMAERAASRADVPLTKVLYEQIYVPLSVLHEHTTGVALLRHVGQDNRLLNTPEPWWTRRRALHTVDTCTGYLAFVLAERASKDSRVFGAYARAHAARMLAPVVTMFVRYARRAFRPTGLWKLVREGRSLSHASGTFNSLATDDERATFAKDRIRQALDRFDFFDDDELREDLLEILIDNLARTDVAGPND